MSNFKEFLKTGHAPTLFSAFLYFDFCFAIWVLNGAMAPFISEQFNLTPAQKGFMISVPIIAGAIMRFPLGLLAQYIGRKNAALVEMGLIFFAMLYGYNFVSTYDDVLAMGVLLGIAGASFGVALSLGSGWFPAKNKGLAMGIAGAGNSGTVLAVLFAPPLAAKYGWQTVYGFAAAVMLIPIIVMIIFAKEPPDREHQTMKEHLACLFEKDGWVFNFIYIITFGGFIGLSNFLPTYFYDQFGVTKIEAGQLTMLAAFMGSGVRIVGGWVSDKFGGITTLTGVFAVVALGMLVAGVQTSAMGATIAFMFLFAALGAGNGALFQLVPLRWPLSTAVAGSMIGEIGALGGGLIPNMMGLSKEYSGSYLYGFFAFIVVTVVAFIVMRLAQKKWVHTWVDKGGRARAKGAGVPSPQVEVVATASGIYKNIIYPVGNSELAEKGIKVLSDLCLSLNAKAILVYVEDKWHASDAVATDSPEWNQIRENWLKEGQALLDREAERLRKFGVPHIEKEMRFGEFSAEVSKVAAERNSEMIVLASQQASPVGTLLMGKRTYNLFRHVHCPILRVVR